MEDSPSSNQNTPMPDITSISPEPIINNNVHVLCYSVKTTGGVAGAGAVIYNGINRKDVIWEKSYNLGKCITHNIAHYTALLKGLEAAHSLGISNIIIENNNYLIGKQVLGEFQCKNEKLRPFYQNVVQMKNTVFDCFDVYTVKDVDSRVRHLAQTAAEVI
uniref:RNase H type-1 domain-containing protein n=1 Tax=Proboscia inermis TaxID=420281 RepID=A0A7S0GDT1_9STRA